MQDNKVWPRYFTLSPSGKHMVVADQFANSLQIFELTEEGIPVEVKGSIPSENAPSFIQFL